MSVILAGAVTLLALPGAAAAGAWYYEWSCAGACSPHQLTISGREGPFVSREDCDYARDRDSRSNDFVREGSLGGLDFCYEVATAHPAGSVIVVNEAPPNKTRISVVEIGVLAGPGWRATGEDAMTSEGSLAFGIEIDAHAGRDVGGGSLQVGLHGTQLEAPLLGPDARTFLVMPFAVGLVLTPQVYHRGGRSVRADLGISAVGLLQVDCDGCAGAVFEETISFGYTLKAGVDVYTSADAGFSLDMIFPRWDLGSASAGNLALESPSWMLRVSLINRPKPD